MKNNIIYTLLIVFCVTFAQGQSGGFFKLYDFSSTNNLFVSTVEKEGTIYNVGFTLQFPRIRGHYVKTDLAGNVILQREFLLDSSEAIDTRTQGIAVGQNQDVYLSGFNAYMDSTSPAGYWRFPMLAKFDSIGNLLWFKNFVDSNYVDVWMQRCRMLSNNRLLLIGQFVNPNADTSGVLLYIVDTAGNLITQKRIFPFFNDNFWQWGYTFLSDGRLMLSGFTYYVNQGRYRRASVLIDSNLNIIWAKEYGALGQGRLNYGFTELRNNFGISVGDISETGSQFEGKGVIEKIRMTDGVSVSSKTFELAGITSLRTVHVRDNGDLMVFACVSDFDTNSSDLLIMRMDSNWNILWKRRYTYPYRPGAFAPNENISETIQLSGDGYLIAGFTVGTDTIPSTQDAFLMKIDTNGCWQSGCNVVGINTDPAWSSKIHMYPNPSNGNLHLENSIPNSLLKVYNMQGHLQYTSLLVSNMETINLESYPSGLYIIQIQNEQGIYFQEKLLLE